MKDNIKSQNHTKQIETSEHFMLKQHLKDLCKAVVPILEKIQVGQEPDLNEKMNLVLYGSLASEYLKSLEDENKD